jgi:DNA-binding MarR family transcriptional regulator
LRASVGVLARRLRQIKTDDELSLSQMSILGRLERNGPATPGVLAAREQIRPQSVAATITVLAAKGLVSRTGDPQDGRRVVVTLTRSGRTWVAGRREKNAQRLAHAIATNLTPDEQRQLIAAIPLLERLGQAL